MVLAMAAWAVTLSALCSFRLVAHCWILQRWLLLPMVLQPTSSSSITFPAMCLMLYILLKIHFVLVVVHWPLVWVGMGYG